MHNQLRNTGIGRSRVTSRLTGRGLAACNGGDQYPVLLYTYINSEGWIQSTPILVINDIFIPD